MTEKKEVEYGVIINRDAFVRQLMDERHYMKSSARAVVEDFTGMIIDNLERGNTVSLHGFGIFESVDTAEHKSTDPNTKELQIVPRHWRFRFKPGAKIKHAMRTMNAVFKVGDNDGGDQ